MATDNQNDDASENHVFGLSDETEELLLDALAQYLKDSVSKTEMEK